MVVGTQNSALSVGGRNGSHQEVMLLSIMEQLDTPANMPQCYGGQSKVGTQNDAYYWGGQTNTACNHVDTINYNGTSWATGIPHIRPGCSQVSAGTANAAITAGGFWANTSDGDHGGYTCVEEYNGSSWSVANSLNVAQRGLVVMVHNRQHLFKLEKELFPYEF